MPAAESAGRTASAALLLQSGEMRSWNRVDHLLKDCVTIGHGQESPFNRLRLAHSKIPRSFRAFLFN